MSLKRVTVITQQRQRKTLAGQCGHSRGSHLGSGGHQWGDRQRCPSSRENEKAPDTGALNEADARTRTADPFITSEVLYQLSYVGVAVKPRA